MTFGIPLHSKTFAALGCALALGIATGAQAVTLPYDLTGSTIIVTNDSLPDPVVEPVTGSLILEDDGLGNVSFDGELAFDFTVDINLVGLAVGTVETDLTVDVGGTGLRTGDVVAFDNPVDFFPTGTIFCQDGGEFVNVCDQAGLPEDEVVNVPEDTPDETFMRNFADLTFGPGDETFVMDDFAITEPEESTQQTLSLQGTLVPEPSTALLVGAGLAGLGLMGRRRR